jgi:prevent-host-death family protein
MKRQVTATEARAKLCELLRYVEAGDEIEITRRGQPVVRLTRATGPRVLKGMFRRVARTAAADDELSSTGIRWNAQ